MDTSNPNSMEALAAQNKAALDVIVQANKDTLAAQKFIYMGQQKPPAAPTPADTPATFDLLANEFQMAGVPADVAAMLAETWLATNAATVANFRDKIASWARTPKGMELRGVKTVSSNDLRTGNYDMGALMSGKLNVAN